MQSWTQAPQVFTFDPSGNSTSNSGLTPPSKFDASQLESKEVLVVSYDGTDTPSTIGVSNASSALQSFTYSDSPAGTIASETDAPSSPQSPAVYTYDAGNRVTSMTAG